MLVSYSVHSKQSQICFSVWLMPFVVLTVIENVRNYIVLLLCNHNPRKGFMSQDTTMGQPFSDSSSCPELWNKKHICRMPAGQVYCMFFKSLFKDSLTQYILKSTFSNHWMIYILYAYLHIVWVCVFIKLCMVCVLIFI